MKKIVLLSICCLVLFFALRFIQIDHTSIPKNELLSIEMDEVANKLTLHDPQGVTYSIPLSSISIYEDYLQEQSDPSNELERTSFEFLAINSSDGSKYGVLSYNCGVKLCTTLLIKLAKNKDIFTSSELGYGMLIDMKQSPSLEHAIFRYAVNEGNEVLRNNLIPVDLEKMVLLDSVSKELSKEFIENAIWPITDYKWSSDKNLSIRVADIQNTDYDSLLTWFKSSKKTKEFEIELVE